MCNIDMITGLRHSCRKVTCCIMTDISPEHYVELENAEHPGTVPDSHVSRRAFLSALAGTGIGVSALYLGLRVDTEVGDAVYGGGDPEIGVVADARAEQRFPRHFNLVLGGFGVYDTARLARAMHPSLKHFGQTAFIKNSNSGLDIEKQKRATLDFLDEHDAEVVNLDGHSMAGMVAVEIGKYLISNGIHVQGVLLDCSPERKYDLRPDKLVGAELLAAVDRYTEALDISGGPVSRFGIESAARILEGRVDYRQITQEALRKLHPKNASNRLLEDQARYIDVFQGSEFGPEYPAATVVGKLRPLDWSADPTINNRTALTGWRVDAFPQLTVHDVAVKGGGHANPGAAGAKYTEAITRFGVEQGLYQPRWSPTRTHIFPN